MKFRVWLGDREIGRHDVTLSRHGDQTIALSKVFYKVKILFVNVFDYVHEIEETWDGNCLAAIDSFTRENGEETTLSGRRNADSFVLQKTSGTVTEPEPCIGTYAYWDMQRVQRERLMNTQTGQLDAARVVAAGEKKLPRLGFGANSMRIETDESTIRLWYAADGEWLALETSADGKPLVYLNETLLQ